MKKMIMMLITVTLALSLSACNERVESKSPAENSLQDETASIKAVMGQVSGKVGNDITLSLGNLIIENEVGAGQTMMVDENGNKVPVDGDLGDAAGGLTLMIPMPGDGDSKSEAIGEIEKLPIEFTGEVREYTIPAGAKILNAAGKEVTMDSITKGSLVQLIINETSGVVETVMVW